MARPKGSKNKKATVTGEYTATIKVLGKLYTAIGATALEAVQNLKPEIARGMSVLVVEHDGKRQEKILNAQLTNRIFGKVSNFNKEIGLKYLKTIFG